MLIQGILIIANYFTHLTVKTSFSSPEIDGIQFDTSGRIWDRIKAFKSV